MKSHVQPPPAVIVAEDEELIRMMATDMLTDAGFAVIEAGHAEEALAILEAQAADIHVLFTDIHMPGAMDGLKLAHHASSHWPWIGLLIASGDVTPKTADMPAGSKFLAKPYNPDHVIAHAWDMIAAK